VELVNVLKYRYDKWSFRAQFNYAWLGKDSIGGHSGNDIFQSTYDTYDPYQDNVVVQQYGNKIGQGGKTHILFAGLGASYLLYPERNLRFEAGLYYRSSRQADGQTSFTSGYIGIRTSLERLNFDF